MNNSQIDAVDRLLEIRQTLEDLSGEAEQLVRDNFPAERNWCDAYRVFDFGTSGNQYDSTFEKLLENIDQQDADGEYDEESVA